MVNPPNILEEAAFKLGSEIHEGKWNHLPEIHEKPAPDCREIVDELRMRCHGFTLEQYQRAIATGLFASR
jgi:hypothetical protein